jgi:hypothetical protein
LAHCIVEASWVRGERERVPERGRKIFFFRERRMMREV